MNPVSVGIRAPFLHGQGATCVPLLSPPEGPLLGGAGPLLLKHHFSQTFGFFPQSSLPSRAFGDPSPRALPGLQTRGAQASASWLIYISVSLLETLSSGTFALEGMRGGAGIEIEWGAASLPWRIKTPNSCRPLGALDAVLYVSLNEHVEE